MIAQEVARKYASALLLSVREKDMIDLATDQFVGLGAMVAEDDSMLDFLTAPQIPDDKKINLVRDVFGPRMDILFVEFLLVLVDKHRINYLPEIIEEFDRLVKAERGILKVTVTTAVPLTEVETERLTTKLAAKSGLKIELEKKVDPSILGGMIVVMHNEIIDGSTRYYLDTIRDQLAAVKVH
jgi:F-type H+-transporting ATPase subunit delta